MFSTMTTAPSTTMPKSSAPSDNRLAGMCARSRQMEAKSRAKGMVSETMRAPRTFPQEEKENDHHENDASVRLCSTVCVV